MQRLFVLFLMFLLPLQVFAGGVELRQEQVSAEHTVISIQQLAVDSACCDFDDLATEVIAHAD
ncbi:MAG: hypothetical protein NWQ13_09290, partial [Glaciimonas sp.]|nr:hypothetical protein [Glaciimonas sp.]